MQPLAAWLVARPQNAVLALAITLVLPVLQILSGIIMVLLVLKQGVRLALIEGAIAGALLLLIALVVGLAPAQTLVAVSTTWLPAIVLAGTLQATRSLTLTLQVSVLVAAIVALGYYVVVDDLVAFWDPVIAAMLVWTRESNLHEQAQLMASNPAMTADMLTLAVVWSSWTLYMVYLLLGYRFFERITGESAVYGRFRDLNFGRVIASIMALVSLAGFASGAASLQGVAFILFAVFWLQGLSVVHWMHSVGQLPIFVVIMTYVLMPILHVFLILALAVLGYTDAWFTYRRRAAKQQ